MSATGRMNELRSAGFSEEEVGEWAVGKRKELSQAGFNDGEIDTYFGKPPFDPSPLVKQINDNHATYTKPTAEGGQPTPVTSFGDALEAGLQMSVSGLLARGEAPNKAVAEDAPMTSRIASSVGTLAGDAPFMIGGALLGGSGGPVTGAAGAFALPAGLRATLMDAYQKGNFDNFGEFWDRASGIFVDTAKAWVTGAATGGAGVVAGKALAPMTPAVRTAGQVSAEIGTMVTVGKALEGQVPTARDFLDAAVVVGGLRGAMKVSSKLRDVYRDTGVRPHEVVQDMQSNPTIAQDLAATNAGTPRAYGKFTNEIKENGGYEIPISRVAKEGDGATSPWLMRDGKVIGTGQDHMSVIPGSGELGPYMKRTGAIRSAFFNDPVEGYVVMLHTAEGQRLSPAQFGALEHINAVHQGKVTFQLGQSNSSNNPQYQKVTLPYLKSITAAATVQPAPPAGSPAAAQQAILGKINVGKHTASEPMSFDRMYTMVIDDLNPIRQAVKEASNGGKMPTNQDPYQLARLTRGTFGKADQMLEHGTFDFNTYKNNGKPLKAILEPVRDDLNGIRAYAASKRTIELNGRGVDSGLDMTAAQQVVKAGAKYEPILRDLTDYQNRLTTYLKDSGVLSPEAHAAMVKANKDYVPFFRVMDSEGHGAGRGLSTHNPIKSIKGSEREIIDPIESIIKNTYLYTSLAERNAVGQKFVDMANGSGRPADFIQKVNPDIRGTTVTDKEMTDFLAQHGIQNPPPDLLTVFRAARSPLAENEIAVFTNGKRSVYEVNPEVAKAFKAADSETVGILTKILAAPAQALRAGSVLSPDFMMRNLVRDQSSAFVLSKTGYLPVFDMMRGAMSLAKKDEHFQNWLKSGGANSALVAVDRRYLQEHIFKLSGETGLGSRAWNVAKSPLEILRVTSELIENSTRLGEFKRAVGTSTKKADIQAAGMASRDVTLDFARMGSKIRALNMISAFLSAHVNGLARTVEAFKDNPMGTTAKVGASITLPSILLYMANRDDPRWKEIPRWQKDMFWLVMTDDHIYRIPKPFELGIVFGSVPERVMESYFNDNPDAFRDLQKTLNQTLLPNMIPTAAVPIIEQFSNRSMFSGSPLIPSHMENILPEYQYSEYTTQASRALGALIGAFPGMKKASVEDTSTLVGGTARALTTPLLIENYTRAWSGGLGVYALQIADAGLRKAGVLPDPEKPASTLADIPVVKAFVVRYPSATAQSIQDFYDVYTERKKSYDTIRMKAAEGDITAVEKTLKFDPNAMVQFDGIKETLTEHSKLIRLIYKNPEVPGDEKRQLIDTLYYRMIELAKTANEELKSLPE